MINEHESLLSKEELRKLCDEASKCEDSPLSRARYAHKKIGQLRKEYEDRIASNENEYTRKKKSIIDVL